MVNEICSFYWTGVELLPWSRIFTTGLTIMEIKMLEWGRTFSAISVTFATKETRVSEQRNLDVN